MPTHAPTNFYPEWKAPAEDGASLLWPAADQLLRQTRENHVRLAAADSVLIQNAPLSRLRSATRAAIGHPDEQILIATGHQTELHHPGVWAKNLLLHAAAPKLGAHALHIAVDTDAPKHLTLRWPGEHRPMSEPLAVDPAMAKAAWSGLLAAPADAWLAHLQRMTSDDPSLQYQGGLPSMLPMFWPLMRAAATTASVASLNASPNASGFQTNEMSPGAVPSLDAALAGAMHALDRSLGLEYDLIVASELWREAGFLTFAHHVLASARQFTDDYNRSLAEYRRRNGIASSMRPMPDLFTGYGAVEAPFWLDDLATGTRTRPSVFDDGDGFRLDLLDGEQFFFDPAADPDVAAADLAAFLSRTHHRLSPRALTLTMFVRLLLADQFVHGIGGGRYDQVTDDIIRRHFNFDPPSFSVTTATLIYPGAAGVQRACLPCLRQEGHHLKHAVLGDAKRPLLAHIVSLPRKSPARLEAFAELQRHRHEALLASPAMKQWMERYDDAQVRHRREKTLFDRELFYAVQSAERLEGLIGRYRDALQ